MNADAFGARRPTILLVNDDPLQLRLIGGLLRQAGFEVKPFLEAGAALSALSDAPPPDLVITDLYMPGIDGWRFCRLLRSPEFNAYNHVPILVLSATFAGDEASRITADLGADAFVPSPVEGKKLVAQVWSLMAGERPHETPRALVVEDCLLVANLLQKAFLTNGFEIRVAHSAEEAVREFREFPVDVAVIDYHLPDRLGNTLLEEFRASRPNCVCVMTTTDPGPELALEWMRQGAAAYVRKPFEAQYVVELCARARRERALLRVEDRLEERTRQLRESEERFKAICLYTADWESWLDPDGKLVWVNPSVERVTGYSATECQTMPDFPLPLIYPEDLPTVSQAFRQAVQGTRGYGLQFRIIRKDGAVHWAEVSWLPIYDSTGQSLGHRSSVRDITDRKEAEERLKIEHALALHLREALTLPQTLECCLKAAIAISNLDSGGIYLVEEDERLTLAVHRNLSTGFIQIVSKYGAESPNTRLVLQGEPVYVEEQQIGLDLDEKRRLEGLKTIAIVPVKDQGRVIACLNIASHSVPRIAPQVRIALENIATRIGSAITRFRAEQSLRESEHRYRSFVRHSTEGIYRIDLVPPVSIALPEAALAEAINRQAVVAEVNDALAVTYGLTVEDMVGHPATDFAPNYAARAMLVLKSPDFRVSEVETQDVDKNGKPISLAESYHGEVVDGCLVRVWGVQRDITEHKRAEEERRQLQEQLFLARKLESIGTLAGGIAHDFNNLLAGIMGSVSVLELDLAERSEYAPMIQEMKALVSRGAQLTRQLMGFARRGRYDAKPLDLNVALEETATVFGRTRKDITIHVEAFTGIPAVLADRTQVEQVLLNLMVNAGQAMPGGGHLMLRTGTRTVSPEEARRHDVAPGEFVHFAITDSGVGMDRETQERIFEPFFTTKTQGQGTGLGLASAYGIIRGHNGFITVDSQPGKGTTFVVHFPVCPLPVVPEKKPVVEPRRGSETILVVDDEDLVRLSSARLLDTLGYRVLQASGGEEAIHLYREHGHRVALVILDLVMPGLSGVDTFAALHAVDPTIKVLLCSGYSLEGQSSSLLEHPNTGFIQKPFGLSELTNQMNRLLQP